MGKPPSGIKQLGAFELWRSLPRPCKLFLVVCIVQAFISGTFAARELVRPGVSCLQDLILILISAIFFLILVLDAFAQENGYQLLVSMASGGLNLVQLIVYATAINTSGNDSASFAVVIVCAILQAITVALARWAYLGFGWRMYSKIACDATLPDAERRRAIGLRLDRFTAVAKLDTQIMCLLLVVGVVNGANPSGAAVPSLVVIAVVGVAAAAAWLTLCWTAVISARPHLGLAAEFTYPLCYIVAAAYMFSSVSYTSKLMQLHAQVYLIVYPILFVGSQTWVWWDARLLAGSEIAQDQRDYAAARKEKSSGGGGGTSHGTAAVMTHHHSSQVPPEILPLVHGAWLLKLPSAGALTSYGSGGSTGSGGGGGSAKRTLREIWAAAKGTTRGRWRYFQLSHDGSTLRWDWRKFVLLVHVESVSCCTADLTITLSLTLEPDLRLKFSDAELHAAWARGLTLLIILLGNPDGLEGRQGRGGGGGAINNSASLLGQSPPHPPSGGGGSASHHHHHHSRRSSFGGSRDLNFLNANGGGGAAEPSSPNRILYRLASASGRASAAGLLSKEAMDFAAWKARKALGGSQPPSPDGLGGAFEMKDLEKGDMNDDDDQVYEFNGLNNPSTTTADEEEEDSKKRMTAAAGGYSVISLHANATLSATAPFIRSSKKSSRGGVLRQRTPKAPRSNDIVLPPPPVSSSTTTATAIVEIKDTSSSLSHPPPPPATAAAATVSLTTQQSWLRRTLTAPVSTFTAGLQHAAVGAVQQLNVSTITTTTTNTTLAGNQATPSPSGASPFDDVEARAGLSTPTPTSSSSTNPPAFQQQLQGTGRKLFATPPSPLLSSRSRHLRSASMDGSLLTMPPVPEGSGSFTPEPALPPSLQARLASSNSPGSTGGGNAARPARQNSPLKPPSQTLPTSTNPSITTNSTAAAPSPPPTSAFVLPFHQQQPPLQQHHPSGRLIRYSSAPMYSLQHALSVLEPSESEASMVSGATTTTTTGLPPPPPPGSSTLLRLASDAASNWQGASMQSPAANGGAPGDGSTSNTLLRYDSLGTQIVPGSKLWQAMFDAGMATYQMNSTYSAGNGGGSVDGSPSPGATPHSVARSIVAVNMELIDFEQLIFGRKLGEGAEGPVYAAWFHETPVAVKRASCQAEVDLHLHSGSHDNVVNLRGLAQHGGHTYLIMELCPRGTLDVLIHQGASASSLKMDPAKLLPIVRSIARGMLHLHTRSPSVLHRDLKPANIFIGHGYVMKIGDFGMARYGADTRAHRVAQAHLDPGKYGTGKAPLLRTLTPGVIGTAAYCAPELLHPETPKASEEFNEERLLKADVYSFGVMLWELLERKRPYSGMDGFEIQTQWVLDPGSMRLPPPKMPESCKTEGGRKVVEMLSDLVTACTAWDADARPSFRDILTLLRSSSQDGDATAAAHLASPF